MYTRQRTNIRVNRKLLIISSVTAMFGPSVHVGCHETGLSSRPGEANMKVRAAAEPQRLAKFAKLQAGWLE